MLFFKSKIERIEEIFYPPSPPPPPWVRRWESVLPESIILLINLCSELQSLK